MPRKKQPRVSDMPFHLLFVDADTVMMKEFDDIEELAMFVSLNGLTRNDYAIIQGDLVKKIPTRSLCLDESAEEEELDGLLNPESGIQVLSPDSIRDLIENEQ